MRGAPLALAACTLLVAATACTSEEQTEERAAGDPAAPAPVELTGVEVDEPLRLGVLVSLGSAPGQGEGALPAAAGAQVAEHRLELGGTEVELEVVDDGGTEEGARDAVADLLDAGVAGIVAATTGDHVLPALDDASAAGTAVLLPYLRGTDLPDGAWLVGPDSSAVDAGLLDAMTASGVEDPFVVTGDGVSVDGAGSADAEELTGTNARPVVARIRDAVREGTVDSVVVAAAPGSQARVLAALQGTLPELPVFLSPEALSPVFAEELGKGGGTAAGGFVTVGTDATDTTTLSRGDRGESAASYFAALRLLAGDPDATDLFGSVPFSQVAGGADTASHDAVVAFAAAASEAGSVEPDAVLAALDGLTVDAGDGLAGPTLDFADGSAVDAADVVALQATRQDPGVRPVGATPGLFWFAVPAGTG